MKSIENELYKKGFNNIAGLDEVGRGCWAGPLVVAICVFDKQYENKNINDSKKLTRANREKVFNEIICDALFYDWIILDAEFVDNHNPKKTSIIGMEKLIEKHKNKIDYCLIDAEKIQSDIPSQSIIKGDSKSQSIAGASIIAKVIRDRIMVDLNKDFPNYHFDKHKGYGTKLHLDALKKYGPIKKIHRFSYKPIKNVLDNFKK